MIAFNFAYINMITRINKNNQKILKKGKKKDKQFSARYNVIT